MVQIVLIRPGSTEFDEQGRIQGTLDIPLSSRGNQEVQRLVGQLKPLDLDMIYTCPCRAARETAEFLAEELEVRLKHLDKVQNVDQGLWQGQAVDEVRRRQPTVYRQWQEQPENVCPPSGETLCEAWDRVESTIARLIRKHEDHIIALVAPEPMASVIRSRLLGEAVSDPWKPNTAGCWEMLAIEASTLVWA